MGNKCSRCIPNKSHNLTHYEIKQDDIQAPLLTSVTKPNAAANVYVALYDFSARTDDDLSFSRGEQLEIIDDKNGRWWKGRSLNSQKEGYIPSNYVEPFDSLESYDWYFGVMKRMHAERLLLRMGVFGAFILRDSESKPGDYSLSIRGVESIKHYRVRRFDHGGFFINARARFDDLPSLIEHYKQSADGLALKLQCTCPRLEEHPTISSLSHEDPWEVPRERITLLRQLGKGNFGEVWEGTWNETIRVAVKMLKSKNMKQEEFLAEATIMKRLSHPKLVQLYAICSGEPIYIILELMSYGSLNKYLQSENGDRLSLSDQLEIASQIAQGMAYLEENNVIHRDVAARNVLVNENNVVKISDFGLSKFLSSKDHLSEEDSDIKFAIKWTAPEAVLENKFSIKSDVWSFGILLYEIITKGYGPYPGMTHNEALQEVCNGYRMPRPQSCPVDLYQHIMLSCWKVKPMERPTFETLQWQLEDYFIFENGNYEEFI